MKKLNREKRAMIIGALVEGNSINSTARMCCVSKLTVLRLLADIGSLYRGYHDTTVRGLICDRSQVDEIWSFVGCKERNRDRGKSGHGDAWKWIAMDADSRFVVSFVVGDRNARFAGAFMQDVGIRG